LSARAPRLETGQAERKLKLNNLGMQGLEYVLGGGIPEESLYFLTGESGSFYATFAQQALYNNIVSKGRAAYYTVEAPSSDIEDDMKLYNWNIKEYVDDGTWVFVRPLPPQLQQIADVLPDLPYEERVNLSSSSTAALTQSLLLRLKEGRWTCLSLSYLLNVYPAQEIINLIMFYVNAVHRYGGVHFLILPAGIHDDRQVAYLKSLVDGVLSFKFVQGFGQSEGEIEVEKMRRIIPKTKLIRHVVQSDGIAIETTARIG